MHPPWPAVVCWALGHTSPFPSVLGFAVWYTTRPETRPEGSIFALHLRPNPDLFVDWDYLPLTPSSANGTYIQSSTEADIGLSYLIERGNKRLARYQAAKNATAVDHL